MKTKAIRFLSCVMVLVMVVTFIPLTSYAAQTQKKNKRYTVLVIDNSKTADFYNNGSLIYTADTALEYVQKAADRFLEGIKKSDDENYIAVVTYGSSIAKTVCDFSNDFSDVKNKIDKIEAQSKSRSIGNGLAVAASCLNNIDDETAKKNVVVFTTGLTNIGSYSYSGKYNEDTIASSWYNMGTNIKIYAYSNYAQSKADELKENNVDIYSIGLFQVYDDMPDSGKRLVEFFRLNARDLATNADYYYPVDDPEKLEFTFGKVADDVENRYKEIEFTYQSGTSDYTAKCYYSNSYFSDSSYNYNASLATMSLSFAMSAFGSSDGGQTDYTDKSKNAKKLLTDIGIPKENIKTNDWFTKKPETDSIGVIVGSKTVASNEEDYTLVAVAVRGAGYEAEWTSNFTIGDVGQHSGFDEAKNNVLAFLKSYIAEQKITGKVKLWITGYSRAAATANLVGGAIDGGEVLGSDISYDKKDVFTYCFETPAGALTSEVGNKSVYDNIFNIINKSDPVPLVAPAAMGFCRYGIDRYLPSKESTANYSALRDNMLKVYNSLDSTDDYIVDDFQMKKLSVNVPQLSLVRDDTENNLSQGVFLSNYVTFLARDFVGTRRNYVKNYQDEIREICAVAFGGTDEQLKKLIESFSTQAKSGWPALIVSYVWNVGVNPSGTENDAFQIISDWLKTAVKDAGITGYSEKNLDSAGKNLGNLMLSLAVNHPNYLTTALLNSTGLAAAHYPELCFSWLASMDRNYFNTAKTALNNGGYRIIRINCAVDVDVYDTKGNKVASIVNEKADTTLNSSLCYGVDEDGQKYVILPTDQYYNISVSARQNETVNYSVSEYSMAAGDYTRNINYFDIGMKTGEVLMGSASAYEAEEISGDNINGSSAKYTLYNPAVKKLTPDNDTKGEKASDTLNVTAKTENAALGVVIGGGAYYYGSFAKVEAAAKDGCAFEGWYINGKLVSRDASYRVCVKEDVELTAKFTKASKLLLGNITENGLGKSVSVADARMVLRAAVRLEELSGLCFKLADTDSDNSITVSDARTVLRMAVQLDKPKYITY